MINRLIPIPFFRGNVKPPLFSELAAWYRGDLINVDGLYYLRDYSGNDYHAPAMDSIIYLNGTDNTIGYGDIDISGDWTIGMTVIIPTAFNDAVEYAVCSATNVFVGHRVGDAHGISFVVTIGGTDYTVDGSGVTIDDGDIHSVIASFRKGSQIALYIDGQLVSNTNISAGGSVAVPLNDLYIGSVGNASSYTEMYTSVFEVLEQYITIVDAEEYSKELLDSTTVEYDIVEGEFMITEYGFDIIESI